MQCIWITRISPIALPVLEDLFDKLLEGFIGTETGSKIEDTIILSFIFRIFYIHNGFPGRNAKDVYYSLIESM